MPDIAWNDIVNKAKEITMKRLEGGEVTEGQLQMASMVISIAMPSNHVEMALADCAAKPVGA